MAKITVNKKVYWKASGKLMTGKVKQILSDHVIVVADETDYLVRKEALSIHPLQKTANLNSRTIIA